ncbi:Anaphase-promoting complex, cyclosome, subunit 3 [Stieleria varia]|uniref:Anaphase-promoting complex, cyclosome, subunit 3 n=2 Tax=Stieleria varia TaxID=2528005 RepID=A0A5C6B3I8_9BACT|nr:Anaphase-promoting complex, cyclosome, subunit 3 [Stieleria varia]
MARSGRFFTFGWLRSAGRKWWNLVGGIPILLVALLVGYLAISCSISSENDIRSRYLVHADAAAASGNHKSATLLYERAMEIRELTDPSLFQMAMSALEAGETAKANTIIQKIAPPDEARYARAHFWRASQLLDNPRRTMDDVIAGEDQLKLALQLEPTNDNIRAALATLYFQSGRIDRAAAEFSNITPQHPELELRLAKSLALLKRTDDAKAHGEKALKYLKEQAARDPDNLNARYQLADCYAFLEEFPTSAKILTELIAQSPAKPEFSKALSTVYVKWETSLIGDDIETDRNRFALLAQALSVYSNDIQLFDRLMQLLGKRNEVSEELAAFLNRNIAEGRALGLSHLILGSRGFLDDRVEPSMFHLERAYELMPNAAIVANNFAWYLLNSDPPAPQRALQILGPIIEKSPEVSALRDTRGMAYLAIQEWRKAVADLEFAIENGLRGSVTTHRGLAEAYTQLGLPELAEEHRRIAEKSADQ